MTIVSICHILSTQCTQMLVFIIRVEVYILFCCTHQAGRLMINRCVLLTQVYTGFALYRLIRWCNVVTA